MIRSVSPGDPTMSVHVADRLNALDDVLRHDLVNFRSQDPIARSYAAGWEAAASMVRTVLTADLFFEAADVAASAPIEGRPS